MDQNGLDFTLFDLKEVVHKWLYLEDDTIIDIIMAAYVANLLNSDPLWLIIIAPPSHAKTELLRAFDDHKSCYFLSNLTPSTLISGKVAKNKKNFSLLFRLNDKVLILKDFTTVLSMRSEQQQEILAQLREVYDGKYSKAFGSTETIRWEGHMGLIAACTLVYDKHHAVISTLGDRFILYRAKNSDREKIGEKAQETVGHEQEMRNDIKNAFHKFIEQFNHGNIKEITPQADPIIKSMINTLGSFCGIARCPVSKEKYTRTIYYPPEAEGPARLIKQFMQLAAAISLVHGKSKIDIETYEIIKHVARDLIPVYRLKILNYFFSAQLFEGLGQWQTTREIAEALNMPTTTAKVHLEDLMVVGLLNRDIEYEKETAPYMWQLSATAYDHMNGSEIFEQTTNEPF